MLSKSIKPLIGESKLAIGVNASTNVCHPWRSTQGVPNLLPYGSWNRLQPPYDYDKDKWKRVDG